MFVLMYATVCVCMWYYDGCGVGVCCYNMCTYVYYVCRCVLCLVCVYVVYVLCCDFVCMRFIVYAWIARVLWLLLYVVCCVVCVLCV